MQKTLYSARNHPPFSSLSVRREKNQFYQEHRTDGTYAFDTLYIGYEKFPQHDFYGVAVGGVRWKTKKVSYNRNFLVPLQIHKTLVIATHGIIKKTQKTPSKEIAKAESIKQIYFENKSKQQNKKKIMEDLRLTSFEDFQDKNFGKIGTPERDAFEKEVDDALQAYRMGEVIL